ncbi:hypothetical protein DAA51_24750 [Bradyrhizobium sp. WBAH10]|nr:hypothetical protein [Bradyrhizobium sp. WBAH30]MDD1547193.1 hypothetical protein [Bradyrhizobium sp. WBAH41]MDD1560764.1 hypothetical protein [Bradyrhizobium sp. WBAH23]MDD1568238.1 hypothetical protein [Bradyrhizobium sp. WBAH33]NRB91785.1 hypothetical protein [Bradyrhizobium sp. WBAH10]
MAGSLYHERTNRCAGVSCHAGPVIILANPTSERVSSPVLYSTPILPAVEDVEWPVVDAFSEVTTPAGLAFSKEGRAFAAERGWNGNMHQFIEFLSSHCPEKKGWLSVSLVQ